MDRHSLSEQLLQFPNLSSSLLLELLRELFSRVDRKAGRVGSGRNAVSGDGEKLRRGLGCDGFDRILRRRSVGDGAGRDGLGGLEVGRGVRGGEGGSEVEGRRGVNDSADRSRGRERLTSSSTDRVVAEYPPRIDEHSFSGSFLHRHSEIMLEFAASPDEISLLVSG